MSALPEIRPGRSRRRLYWKMANKADDIRASHALRYRAFSEEKGTRLDSDMAGYDRDRYDSYCQHLLVRESRSERVVG